MVRDAIAKRLKPAGWTLEPDTTLWGQQAVVAEFRKPLFQEFSATASVERSSVSSSKRGPLTVDDVSVGVSYEPLRRLWPLWAEFGGFDEIAISLGELLDPPRVVIVTINGPSDANRAGEELSALILEHAMAFAASHASVSELLKSHRDDGETYAGVIDIREAAVYKAEAFEREALALPAVLAASGQLAEAQRALRTYRESTEAYAASREYRAYARRLSTWIERSGEN